MKPLSSESEDDNSLQALGRASVQIVHDLKNQLNGLKLYATFLRRRLEKGDRPGDELDTIKKLIAGIDRTAEVLALLSQYGEPVEVKKQGTANLETVLRGVVANLNGNGAERTPLVIEAAPLPLIGEADASMLAEAFKAISIGAAKFFKTRKLEGSLKIQLSSDQTGSRRDGIIDWHLMEAMDHDPFRSFAGTDEIRMSLAAKVIEAHGGTVERRNSTLRIRLPLVS